MVQFGGTFQGLLHYIYRDMRKLGGSVVTDSFKQLMLTTERFIESRTQGTLRQLEKDYWNFDPRRSVDADRTKMKNLVASEGVKGTLNYYATREAAFFRHLFHLLHACGFNHISVKDVDDARFKSFGTHRFKVNYHWLSSNMINANCICSKLHGKLRPDTLSTPESVFGNAVSMYVRGRGRVKTEGYFYLEKAEALQGMVSSKIYYVFLQLFPYLSELLDPDVYGWETAYLERHARLRASKGKLSAIHQDITTQLLGDFSLRHLLGKVTLKEETFKDVVVVFRRRRPRQAIDVHSLWRTGGGVFNPYNIVVRKYKDVPRSDIKVLMPEKRYIHKPADYVTLASSLTVLSYTVMQAVLMGWSWSFPQLCVATAAGGYAYRMAVKLQASAARHTQLMDSLRDRNLTSTGIGALHDLHHDGKAETLKLALLVYYVLIKAADFGRNVNACCAWDGATLEDKVIAEHQCATQWHAEKSGFGNTIERRTRERTFVSSGILAERVTSMDDLGGVGLWTFSKDPGPNGELNLKPELPSTAHYILKDKWAKLI